MCMFSIFKPLLILLSMLVFCTQNALGQNKTVSNYTKEIGLDFAPLLYGKTGLGLVLKTKIGVSKGQKWTRQKALRGLFGYYQHEFDPIVNKHISELYSQTDSILNHHTWAYLIIGLEQQHRYKRLQFHYGMDLGYWQGRVKTKGYQTIARFGMPPGNFYFRQQRAISQLHISCFGGISYRFTKKLNLGTELSIPYILQYSNKGDGYSNLNGGDFYANNFQTAFGTEWFRLLYLGYRFHD